MPEVDSSVDELNPLPYAPGATTLWNNSWRRIYDQFGNAILAFARRRGLNDHSAEDVLQEVMVALIRCQLQPANAYNPNAGSFQAWLWGIIRNRVRSVRRKDDKEEVLPASASAASTEQVVRSLPEGAQPPHDFEQSEEAQWQHALFAAALRKVEARVTPENFSIFAALLEERATIEELALTHAKKPNAIYALKHRCEEMLLVEARALRAAWEELRVTSD
jgi:RNA polymerase sigma factor (sigma-70 family)